MLATPVYFYKQDHAGDPIVAPSGRIILGVEDCKRKMRATLTPGNLIVAIGGRTAIDGLADRLTWAGVVSFRRPDDIIEAEGYYLGEAGPISWRTQFPKVAAFVDRVTQGHRNHAITSTLQAEFRRMFAWGAVIARSTSNDRRAVTQVPCSRMSRAVVRCASRSRVC